MGVSVFPAASSAGVTQKVSTFTSTGTFTAPTNCSSVEITLVGGGGGGGGARYAGNNSMRQGGGGGGGLVVKKQLSVTPGTSYTVTIGAGGSGGTYLAAGSVGSDSTFGSLATALGGGSGASRNGATTTYHAVPRGTGGGTYGNQNGVSGAGGGAGGSAILYSSNNTANYLPFNFARGSAYIADNNSRGRGGGAGGQSFGVTADVTTIGIAGIGIDGFGNGAPGTYGTTDGTLNYYVSSGYANQVPQAVNQGTANGTAATANTGDGGNGGCSANINDEPQGDATGGAGGSGICIVTYWS